MHPSDLGAPTLAPDSPPAASGRVRVRWLGTAGYALSCDGYELLIDPYVTRPGLARVLFGRVSPDLDALARVIPRADAILVGHSHFDHALDVPAIARRTGAKVFGSRSTGHLLAAAGVPPEQFGELAAGRRTRFEAGPFRVTAIPSLHSPLAWGRRPPFPGEIPPSCELPTRARHYRCGEVFAFHIEVAGQSLFHLGSANVPDDARPDGHVDLLLMCIAARFTVPDFVPRALALTHPDRVMPMHYDNFFRDLRAPLQLLPRTRFGAFVDEVHRFDPALPVLTLPLLGTLELGA